MEEQIVASDSVEIKNKRNYSFINKDAEVLDVVEDKGVSYIIPAQPGSCYWAILKVAYENHDKPIRKEDFIDAIAQLLEERDPEKWARFVNKKSVKTYKNNEVVQKEANDWRKRIETNIKTMCRHGGPNPYGQRICERGHILRWEADAFEDSGGYCLRTDTNKPLPRKKKVKEENSLQN